MRKEMSTVLVKLINRYDFTFVVKHVSFIDFCIVRVESMRVIFELDC